MHRETGHLVLFAPPGSPEYSLYSFDLLPDVSSWVEVCAAAWLKSIS